MKLIATLRENNIEGVNKKNHTSVNMLPQLPRTSSATPAQ